MRFSRPLTLTVALSVVLLTALVPIGPSADADTASASDSSASGTSKSVSLVLAPRKPALLERLATTSSGTRAARRAKLATTLPGEEEHEAVAAVLARQGLTVTSETTWTVTATADSDTVADVFGTRPKLPKDPTAKQFRAATGSLPDQPTSLDGLVTAVYPVTGGPQVFQHQATSALTGADVRNADTPAGVAPSSGQKDGGLTIATLQLADFDESDLSTYADDHGLDDPVDAGRYREVKVDGGPTATDDAGGGAVEAALDQESILSTAPSANQAAYFAPNTNAGYADVFSAVYDDVTGDRYATSPDPHIVALSVSWGACEAVTGSDFISGVNPILQALVSAGVTIFAAAGDAGIYDCGSYDGTGNDNHQADVDYPASSPSVVATGGTLLRAATSAPNKGRNWTEAAWSCDSRTRCQSQDSTIGTGGSGGGVSGSAYGRWSGGLNGNFGDFPGFSKPLYQRVTVTSAPFTATSKRMLPDITADGDPSTGFEIYSSDPSWLLENSGSHTGVVGGTSLAAPLSAAQLANTLGDAGRTTGVGDIHAALYSAYAVTKGLAARNPAKAFRDVKAGQNGASGDRGADPSVNAKTGYDTISGLGGVLWSALRPYLLKKGAPKVTVTLTKLPGRSTRRKAAVRVGWHSVRGSDPLVVASSQMVLRRVGGKAPLVRSAAANGTSVVKVSRGARLRLTVTAEDLGGHSTTRHAAVRAVVKLKHRR